MEGKGLVAVWVRRLAAIPVLVISLSSDVSAAPRPDPPDNVEVNLAAPPVRVPMQHSTRAPLVEVMVNGDGPFPFRIDASSRIQAAIDPSLVERCRLPASRPADDAAEEAPGAPGRHRVRIDALSIGRATFSNLDAVVEEAPENRIAGGEGPALGSLGLSLFAGCLLTVDFPGSLLIMEPDPLPARGEHVAPLESRNHLPAVDLNVGDRILKAVVDFAFPGGILLSAAVARELALEFEAGAGGVPEPRNGAAGVRAGRLNGTAAVAGHEVANPAVSVTGAAGEARVGYDILREFSLSFDQRHNRMRVLRGSTLAPADSPAAAAPGPTGRLGRSIPPPASVRPDLPPERTELPWSATAVPMDLSCGVPVVQATVNAQGPYPFFLHTGSAATLIDRELARDLGLAPDARAADGLSAGIPVLAAPDLVRVEDLMIGEARFHGVQALLCDCGEPPQAGAPEVPRGVLGFSLFARCLLSLDYPHASVVLQGGELMVADGQKILDFTLQGGLPTVDLFVDEVRIPAHIDTGATGGVMIPSARQAELRLRGEPAVIGRARLVNEDFVLRRAALEGKLKIGAHELEGQEVIFNGALREFGKVGSGFLAGFELVFDQRNRRVRVSA